MVCYRCQTSVNLIWISMQKEEKHPQWYFSTPGCAAFQTHFTPNTLPHPFHPNR